MNDAPQMPTNPVILQCLGLFEAARRMGADPDHIFFVANEDVGVGLLVGTMMVQLMDAPETSCDELTRLWSLAAAWWNSPDDAREKYLVFRDFVSVVMESDPLFVAGVKKSVESCPRGFA